MRHITAARAVLCGVIWLAACDGVPPLPPPDTAGAPRPHAVAVVSNGWHTAIVVERGALVATGLVPEAADFPDAAFLEFGWGDRVYYPAKQKTLGMALDALLLDTPAVMHLAGLATARTHPDAETITVSLTQRGFVRLAGAIGGDFDRPDGVRATAAARGLYPDSAFYRAHGAFSLFNTCNTWTAKKLRAAGIDIVPSGITTADELMTRLRAALATARP